LAAPGSPGDETAPATRAAVQQPLVSLFTTDDYPQAAMRAGEQGTSEVGLTIGTDGRVDKCEVLTGSGSVALDEATCTIFRSRARFTPARDKDGQAVIDHTSTRIRWALPSEPFEERYARAVFPLGPPGQKEDCTVETSDTIKGIKLDCDELAPIKQEFLTELKPDQASALVVEMGRRVGGSEAVSAIGEGPGLRRLAILAFTLTLDESGKVVECRAAVPSIKEEAVRKTCESAKLERYEERVDSSKDMPARLITSYQAVYLRGASQPPKITNLPQLFSSDDYPADALAAGREGTTVVKVAVEADGRATSCQIVASAGMASLDARSCGKIMASGKFEPGRDAHNRPHRAELLRRVRWELPVSPVRDSFTRVLLELGPDKSVRSCSIEGENDGDFTCEEATTEAALALQAASMSSRGVLVVETGELVGSGESVEHFGTGKGQASWYLSAVTLEIAADGKVVGCKPTFDWMRDEYTAEDCRSSLVDKFTALEPSASNRSSRYLTRYTSIYFRN